jgi:hypothetical protein
MRPYYMVWLRRILVLVLFASALFISIYGELFIWNAPLRYQGEGTFSEDERVAIMALARMIAAALVVLMVFFIYFSALLILVPKQNIYSNSRFPRLARLFYYLSIRRFLGACSEVTL